MRIPSSAAAMRPTRPSAPHRSGGTTGPQGTAVGGANQPRTGRGQRKPGAIGNANISQSVYLWGLVLIEAAITGVLRRYFRRFHGG